MALSRSTDAATNPQPLREQQFGPYRPFPKETKRLGGIVLGQGDTGPGFLALIAAESRSRTKLSTAARRAACSGNLLASPLTDSNGPPCAIAFSM